MSRIPNCPSCIERLSNVEAGLIGVWICVYCEGAWLANVDTRKLLPVSQGMSLSAPATGGLLCPGCNSRSFSSIQLRDGEIHACSCGSAFLPKGAVTALRHELGGHSWQLGKLLSAALFGREKLGTADAVVTVGGILVLLLS
jgi:Zn-finger nucleic acid-binding protein